ncbi:uncharacterized protein FOMMEDRAFT_161732 [Fomitiporia mediterranea MF3/22]|uniref:uncharacterized protein n=1 Tax=Fomitiporia mediterranea (strain MF3/22) TaxID=694068 RepID=UPI0004409CA8|nr:uncharacterized protein FOMMEDRAFT_161732 [Fomitiporia mediterranea MF3/22]EJC98364.1 hypothetical protein FOMMEDRAFT_161732 [Fomitiporia mediterranea MF3/22]
MDPFDDIDLEPLLDASVWHEAHECFPDDGTSRKKRPYEDLYEVVPLWLYARTCLEEENEGEIIRDLLLTDREHQRPVNRLPRNILALIFEALRDTTSTWHPLQSRLSTGSSSSQSQTQYVKPYSWLDITLVCRHWRNTAYTHPSLWTYVDLSYDREVVRSLLILSEDDSLYIYSDTSTSGHEVTTVSDVGDYAIRLDLVMDEQARIKELELNLSSTKHVKLVPWKQFCSHPSPRLTKLVCRGTSNNIKPEKRRLPAFKKKNLPLLRELVLDGLYPKWSETCIPTLTHLEIRNVNDTRDGCVREFNRFLSGCTELRELKLESCNLTR